MGFRLGDEGAKTDKLVQNGRGYDGVEAYPLLGTMMHVGVTNLVADGTDWAARHDANKCTGEFACKRAGGSWCVQIHRGKWID